MADLRTALEEAFNQEPQEEVIEQDEPI